MGHITNFLCQVPHVFGILGGFGGLPEEENWVELTAGSVQERDA